LPQSRLIDIFSTLLGKPVGLDDNLLDLGAHSLLMMRAAAQICAAFDVSIDVATLFAAPRVSAVARAVEAAAPAEIFEAVEGCELSLGQLRMWIVRQLAADPALYNIATVVRLRRDIAIEELDRALTTLVERHDALRTVVREDGNAFVETNVRVHVTRGTDIREEVRKPFDLSCAPLIRAALVDDALVITLHHIASDAWSTRILLRELAALLDGETLPEAGARYAEYAAWQRRWLASPEAEASLAFWRERLAGIEGTLEIPADRPRPAVQSGRGGVHRFALDEALLANVTDLAHAEGATPYMVLLAVFQLLLQRITRQRDVVVGSPIAGRDQVRFETTAGFFVNTIVQRTRIEAGESFRGLVRRVREGCMSAYAHGRMPFDRIVEELRPQRDLASHPIFQALFALQETPLRDLGFGALEDVSTDAAKFDVMLEIESQNAKLTYAKDLFDATTMERFARHYVELLRNAIANPDCDADRIPLRSIDLVNEPAVPYPSESLGELFARQVRATPDRIAVVDGEASITYRELDERASAIAATIQPATLVEVRSERSIAFIAQIVGIIKAGAAYMPLDPDYPAERLAFMSDDAVGAPIAADTAYLIYTSGSTGTPKGVAVPQSAIKRLVFNTNYVPFEEPQRIAQISNASFDAATFEIWGALLHGGTLFIFPREVILSATAFAAELRRQQISALFITTALFNQHVREVPDTFATVQHVLFGGEACDPNAVALCLAGGPPRRLLNVYGPTESTTFASWHLIEHANGTSIPIGRPIANTTLYVVDEYLAALPIGMAGELCIGGDGLAHGYHRRPALTAERFIPNPFGPAGSRLYRTGDLARVREDGAIEYLGRLDDQVKIRGFRIELGEIESVLRELVDDACVIVRDGRLIAYVVWTAATQVAALTPTAVRAATGVAAVQILRAKLPEYMIPSAFVTLDALPLNANGKVDRRALPEPGLDEPVSDAPRTETE
jgi:amino acid adenylation domain-containing protein